MAGRKQIRGSWRSPYLLLVMARRNQNSGITTTKAQVERPISTGQFNFETTMDSVEVKRSADDEVELRRGNSEYKWNVWKFLKWN